MGATNERPLTEDEAARARAAGRRHAEHYRGKLPDEEVEALAARLEREYGHGIRWGIDPDADGLV